MIKHLSEFIKNKAGRATGIIFACSGLVFGSWASFIPYVKEKFSLDEAQLGLLLLSMPFGVFVVNPISVILIRKWGAVKVALLFVLLTGFAFLLPITMPWIEVVAFGLFISGASFGITNVSMNTCASALEETSGLKLFSACHGMWSVGAMIGALFSGLSLIPFQRCCGHFIEPQILYVSLQAFFVGVTIFWIRNHLGQVNEQHVSREKSVKIDLKTLKPGKELWMIISICICSYLAEGTIMDWSAVYLRDVTNASENIAGRGFAVYAFFMAAGRFLGDELIFKFGNMRVLRVGGLLVLIGLILIIVSTNYVYAMPGFMLTGAGISIASPILYQAAARVKGLAPGIGLATMNTFAMAAFLGGPVLIGFIAELFNLRIAFLLVAFASIIWIIQTTRVINTKTS